MKLVVLSTLGAVHRYVVAEVARRHRPVLILQPAAAPPRKKVLDERLSSLREAPLATLKERFERRVRDARVERSEAVLERVLFDGEPPSLDATPVLVNELHAPATLETVRALAPDVLLVSGAPVLKPELFTLPRICAVNVHYGVAPEYRGEDTFFWPLVHEDYAHLGVTLHAIERGVDSGLVFAHGFMARTGGETETDLWASAARLAARLVDAFLTRLSKKGLSGVAQPPGGRQYFRRERTALWEARHRAMRALGRVPPPAEERIVVY